MTPNEISHYESLKKLDTKNRKLIKKLQLERDALKKKLRLHGVSQQRELCDGNCGLNYCDENGCVDNKPDLGEPKPPEHCC